MDQQSLDAIGILEGTNKTSFEQDYLRQYERLFSPIRGEPIQLLEIGVGQGGSLRTWMQFFPNATVIGVDIRPESQALGGGRVRIEVGSQSDPAFLAELASKYKPRIIIDDGSHVPRDILMAFEYLFPSLEHGGSYVVEDLHLHYGANAARYRRSDDIAPTDYFGALARGLSGDYSGPESVKMGRPFVKSIDCVEFIHRALIVRKRQLPTEPAKRAAYLWDMTERSGHAVNWAQLALVLLRQNELERAEVAARMAVKLAPNPAFLFRLAFIQSRLGRLAAAIESARSASHLAPDNPRIREFLAGLEQKVSEPC